MRETFRAVRQLVKEGKLLEADQLAASNPDLNGGVQILFNGNAWLRAPSAVPREDWMVISPHVILETDEAIAERAQALSQGKI